MRYNDSQLMDIFENEYHEYKGWDRHHKEFFVMGNFYKHPMLNQSFVIFRQGYLLNDEGK